MRRSAWLGVALTACLSGAPLRAEEPKVLYRATVTANEAEVRSGAGDSQQLYPTNRLVKGDTVEVVREQEGGWLAIKPPPGSFSWINSRFVQRIGNTSSFVVNAHPDSKVPLLLGSSLSKGKPTVEGAKVVRGTQLRAIGPLLPSDDGYWLPVEPPATEVRYVRADAVARKGGENVTPPVSPPGAVADPAAPTGPPGFSNPAGPATPPSPAGTNPLWAQAEQAEQAGRYQDAIRLYTQLGAEASATNHGLSVAAYNKAERLTDALAGRPPRLEGSTPAGQSATTTSNMVPTPQGMVTSPPGWLRRSGRTVDYSTLYILENSMARPILYATPMAGYSLEQYSNRNVELIGTQQYRADLRGYLLTVTQIRPLR